MLTLPPVVRVFVALDPIDMRASFDGLAAAVAARMRLDPLSGHLFVFLNRSRSLMKILFWDRSGLCILYKRLERGTFQLPRRAEAGERVEISPAELGLILEGIDLESVNAGGRPQPVRYTRPATGAAERGI